MPNHNSTAHPLAGSRFMDKPPEKHDFESSKNSDFLCSKCGRPRALHEDMGVMAFKDTPWRPSDKERKAHRQKEIDDNPPPA